MRKLCTRNSFIVLLIIVVITLQVIHQRMLELLNERTNGKGQHKSLNLQPMKITKAEEPLVASDLVKRFQNVFENTNIFDPNGGHRIHPNILQKLPHQKCFDNLTLVSHCSLNHLHNLVIVAERWGGPMSVTVFIPTHLTQPIVTVLMLAYACATRYNPCISIHLVQPLTVDVSISFPTGSIPLPACEKLSQLSNQLSKDSTNYNIQGFPYPNNMLRNVGVKYSQSDFVFVVDIDMVPDVNLHKDFVSYLVRHRSELKSGVYDKVAFVVPAFEADASSSIPEDRKSLLKHLAMTKVRPFYFEVCKKCQKQTMYDTWRSVPDFNYLDIAYEVSWEDPWEPFYIAKKEGLPQYEEKFMQFGFNRISQVCELHMAGYRFSVLNNAFLVHQGFKKAEIFHKTKDDEQERNRKLFREFKDDLKLKYKDTDNRC